MQVNSKRGLFVGFATASTCTLMFALFWYFTLPPDFDSDHSINRWWRGQSVSATLCLAALLFFLSGLIGFTMAAFRPPTEPKNGS